MSTYQEQFAAIFERAAQDKTFSFEAIKQINEMRTMFETLQSEKTKVELELKTTREALSSSTTSNTVLTNRIKEIEDLNLKKEELSRKDFELKVRVEQVNRERDLAVDLFKTVFANVTLRKDAMRAVGGAINNGSSGYISTSTVPEHETITEV